MNLLESVLISNDLQKGGSGEQIAAFRGPWNLSQREREIASQRREKPLRLVHSMKIARPRARRNQSGIASSTSITGMSWRIA